jgi:HEPN domain-containing protein
MRLAETAGLDVDEKRADFLRELSSYYIQTRYPEEIDNIATQVKKQEAKQISDHTQEVMQCLASML